jgi:cell division protein ZapE
VPHTVRSRYNALVSGGSIEADPAQLALIERFDRLITALAETELASKSSALGWLFGRKRKPAPAPKGLYVWGQVGRGKTMLMDLFFDAVPVARKRRVHFHAFMAEVHGRIQEERRRIKDGQVKDGDPIRPVADSIAAETRLLCFDEFVVTDIADAMLLGRLFTRLFEQGLTVVMTSNVDPDRLYEGGLNRALFLPFLALLNTRVDVVRLDSRTDFRLEKLGGAPVYHCPDDPVAATALDRAFLSLSGVATGNQLKLDVQGHDFDIPQVAGGVARASFDDLCAKPYGASDYLALARICHTLVLDHVPVMDEARRNEAKRFILLIDTLYDYHVKLIASAAAAPQSLYVARSGYEAFAFDRTVSRLIEMQSDAWLALPHGKADSAASGDSTGLVET